MVQTVMAAVSSVGGYRSHAEPAGSHFLSHSSPALTSTTGGRNQRGGLQEAGYLPLLLDAKSRYAEGKKTNRLKKKIETLVPHKRKLRRKNESLQHPRFPGGHPSKY